MPGPRHLFKRCKTAAVFLGALAVTGLGMPGLHAKEADFSDQEGLRFYSDLFNDNIYYEGVDYLNFETLYHKITHKKIRALDVNIYDEVPDSSFFTNRHARNKMSPEALEKGPLTNGGPDLSGPLAVIGGEAGDQHPRFFVRDNHGDIYQLQFDAQDGMELSTGAEVVGSRFYYALGYNVSESSIVLLDAAKFTAAPGAMYYANSGFKRPLTAAALQDMLLFIPYNENGKIRASAAKVLDGVVQGPFGLRGRRSHDASDAVRHENLRAIRALRIFAAWLNHDDVRSGHTVRVSGDKNGRRELKNYLLDYSSTLGSDHYEAKHPPAGYEYLLDYGETAKAFLSLGLWEKPWQKKWREAKEQTGAPAYGYFGGGDFNPGKFKTQLPGRAFKSLTRADAFWAAKLIMAFSDDDIKAMVKAGGYTHPQDADRIAKTLSERRDQIGKYWFSRANPLDSFDLSGGKLVFNDLAVSSGFAGAEGTVYQVQVKGNSGAKQRTLASLESSEPSLAVDPAWFKSSGSGKVDVVIRTLRKPSRKPGPFVKVTLSRDGILGIAHQD